MKKFAGVIITFARPQYYKKMLTSLEKADGNNIDWYVFQDNIYNSKLKKKKYLDENIIKENIEITNNSSLNIVNNFICDSNKGVNYQINNAVSLLYYYNTLLIFEDDLIVSPYYLQLLKRCSIQYPNIVVTFHSIPKKSVSIPKDLSILQLAKRPRLWGFYLTRNVWNNIKDTWYDFYSEGVITPYYDVIFTRAIRKNTDGKYEALVPRAYNIGEEGILSTNEISWKKRRLDMQTKNIEYIEDKQEYKFTLMET